jgi:threonine dehydrogenase-like Zn-dependent dehydrogenase
VIEIDEPTPERDEVLVRTLRVGIDGTDHEVISGDHGEFPVGSDYQILGHEAVGVIVDSNDTGADEGDVVVPTVRRLPGETPSEYFEHGEPDMAPPGEYVERGIVNAHGYMAEYFTTSPEYLVSVPDRIADSAFLVEPISNAEKAFELASASRSTFTWDPEAAFVLGNGPLGLLTLAMLADRSFDRLYCLGRRNRPDPTIDVIERLGATYVDSRRTPVDEVPTAYEPMDLIVEATGHAKHAFETIDALGPNGVGALLGIPTDWTFDVGGGRLHREFVLENKALVGSVNSRIPHFERAIETIASYPQWFIDSIVTHVFPPEAVADAFETSPERIKTVIEFDTR